MDVFCKINENIIPSYTIYEDDLVRVILDIEPRSNGHCLIIPKKHYLDLNDIEQETLNHIMKIAKKISKLLTDKLSPESIILIQNNGQEQEIKHYHLHIIPKYNDINIDEVENIYNLLTKGA